MAYEPTIQMDNDEFQNRSNKGWGYALAALGIEDWPADGYMITYDDDVFRVVPVRVCDAVSIWGTLDTNVSPAKLAIAAITNSDMAAYMSDPVEESGIPGIEPVARCMRGYLNQDEALAALRAELEV